jgi:hypothetical protein
MCGWCAGEFFAIRTLLEPSKNDNPVNLFMLIWLTGWTFGGFTVLRLILWNLWGREVVTIGNGRIKLDKKGAIFYGAKSYDLNEAKDFRVFDDGNNDSQFAFGNQRKNNPFTLDTGGMIRFDYGLKTIKFAAGIDEAEAKFILSKLTDKKYLASKNI